jgi:hypothetical protein
MVHERTQIIERQGTQNTMSFDDDNHIPIVSFMNVKKKKKKKEKLDV